MVEENISQEFRLTNIDETKNYFLKEIKQNELMSRKHKMFCTTLNYIKHFLEHYWMCFNFCFCFFAWYFLRNYEFYNKIKNKMAIAAAIKNYKSIIKKKKKEAR